MLSLTLQDIFGRNANDNGTQIVIPKTDLSFFTVGLDTYFDVEQCVLGAIFKNLERTFRGYLLDSDLLRIIDENNVALLYKYESEYTEAYLSVQSKYIVDEKINTYYQLHIYSSNTLTQTDDYTNFITEDTNNVHLDKSKLNLADTSIKNLLHSFVEKLTLKSFPNFVVVYLGKDEIYKRELQQTVSRAIYTITVSIPDIYKLDSDNLI